MSYSQEPLTCALLPEHADLPTRATDLPPPSERYLDYSEDGEPHSNSQKGINIAIIDASFGSVLHLRPADKYKMSELKEKEQMLLLGILCYGCFPKKFGSLKAISLKTCRHHLLIEMNTSLVKKMIILYLAPHTFAIVHYVNIWTNVNSYNHNT